MSRFSNILGFPLRFITALLFDNAIPLEGIIVTGIIIFIVALILSKKTSCIIMYGWWDFFFVLAPVIIFVVHLFFNIDKNEKFTYMANILIIASTFTTIAISVYSNIRYNSLPQSIFYTIISLLVKPFVMLAMPVLALTCFAMLDSAYKPGKKDARYKSGERPSEKAWLMAILLAIIGFLFKHLVAGIVKNPQEIREQAAYNEKYEESDDDEDKEEDDEEENVDTR